MLFNISVNCKFVLMLVVLVILKIDSSMCNVRMREKHRMSQWLVILKRQFVSFKICKKVDPKNRRESSSESDIHDFIVRYVGSGQFHIFILLTKCV